MEKTEVPVLIVGGGPAGLTAALLLARQGVPALLVERHVGTSVHPRARGLNVRTMEIYRGLGLEDPIREAGAALAASRYMLFVDTLAGAEIRRIADDELAPVGNQLDPYTPCNWCQCAQDDLEPILAEAARQAGAALRFGTELVAFTQDADGITATLRDRTGAAEHTVRAPYLIAADGAGSPIRQALGVPTQGRGVLDHFINIYFRADLRDLVQGREFGICFVENPAASGLFLAVNNTDRWLFNYSYDPAQTTAAAFTPDRCIALVRAAVGVPDLPVEILSVLPWEEAAWVAEQMRAGRVFLAGDAAHVMPPAGGFGLNTGVQDVHNLAWKLAAVLDGRAAPALLDTYAAERLPVAHLIVDQAVREVEAPTPDTPGWPPGGPGGPPPDAAGAGGPPGESWGNDADGEGPPGGWGGDLLDQLAPVLGYRYRSQAVIGAPDGGSAPERLDLSGQPGTRAPHAWVQQGGVRRSTLDLVGTGWVLFAGAEGQSWIRAAASIGSGLDAYRIAPDGDLVDADGNWAAAYGITPAGAVLIRPDGFVAWRSPGGSADATQALEQVWARVLGR